MTKNEAITLLDKVEHALANGRVMISTIQPIDDFVDDITFTEPTYADGRHDGYLVGLRDGIEASMGMVEHLIDTLEGIEGIEITEE